ncbi:glycoside hydrolase family 88 protein [Umezawaea tangerina]|uniref:Rhamnogalacturonyl hydrolase YesR n=1 Tax=Umezawaea tangerina TaxID=84725 RepID=A0A2T0SE65_9PSEU|nr:glycoside hydrolase family 88 protein [Umezawaea tangerina]PRY31681.1 rhamnogalacturonyl hydrolase YesR [Umezawaea tangerina]
MRLTTALVAALASTALVVAPAAAATTRYEAEQATRSMAVVESNHVGFTGSAFVNFDNTSGSSVAFAVDAAVAGNHDLVLRYANGTAVDRPLRIEVNGTVVTAALPFPGTGAWTTWATRRTTAALVKGRNTIRAVSTTADGGPNLDSLVVDNGVAAPAPADWSTAVVDATIARRPAASLGLGYTDALFLYGTHLVHDRTGDPRYLDYLKAWGDAHVAADGGTGSSYDNLDSMLAGNVFLALAAKTGEQRYTLAATRIRQRLTTYPRTTDGGFLHNVSFTGQLWSDGAFMAQPFLARYGAQVGDSAYAFDEATRQLVTYFGHLRSPDGMLFHAYDETRKQGWANPTTGLSPEVWCRAVGWFGMATVDVLEVLPRDHPNRAALVGIVEHLASGFQRWQDPATGRWFQLPTKPGLAGNWTETSCSSMFAFTVSRAVQRGYLPASYLPVAERGYRGVLARTSVGADGRAHVDEVGVGTNVGNERYYLDRPRATDDFHGLGAFVIMNEQLAHPRS